MKTKNAKNEEVKRDAKGRVIGFCSRSGKMVTPETALVPEPLPSIANTQDELLSGDPRKEEKLTRAEKDASVTQKYFNAMRQRSAHSEPSFDQTDELHVKDLEEERERGWQEAA
jgi:hypothetical protein